jgi:hypothetical protein
MSFKSISRGWQGKQTSAFDDFRRQRKPVKNVIVRNGLKLHYDFSNGLCFPNTGTTAVDLSGSSNDGTLTNGPTYSTTNDGLLSFDGVNDFISATIINIASNGTISMWMRKTGTGSPDAGNIVDLAANVSAGGTNGWSLGVNTSANKLEFYIANNGGFGTGNQSTAVIANDRWYNVVATYNGANKILYVNGVQDSSFASTVNGTNTSTTWGIASRTAAAARRYFQGQIPQAAIYDRALTPSEIKANFDALKARFGV